MDEVTVDFIAFDEARGACLMVLVEEGPWTAPAEVHLADLQDRIYGCLDAALDGQLAAKFPEARGKQVVVQIDCYDLPSGDVDSFLKQFAAGVASLPDYSTEASPFVREFLFEVTHGTALGEL
jgi:hypothetical protein